MTLKYFKNCSVNNRLPLSRKRERDRVRGMLRFIFFLITIFITACSSTPTAPIVEGWHQAPAKQSDYIVQKGDTLYSIAWAFDMDFRDLARINHLSPPYPVHVGQHLAMSPATAPAMVSKQTTFVKNNTNLTLPPVHFSKTNAGSSPKKITSSNTLHYAQIPSPDKINLPAAVSAKTMATRPWLMPATGKIVRRFSLTPGGSRGIEIAGRVGQPVVASSGGKVVYSGSGLRGYGNLIIIKHNDTYLSAYANNKKLLVKEGMTVTAGQRIALMGTNNAGQPVLHFEIRRNGKPVDPMTLL